MSSEILFNFLLAEFNFLIPSFINFSAFLKSFLWADLIDLEEIPIISLVSPYRELREEFKSKYKVLEVYLFTTEIRGRENFFVKDYEKFLTFPSN